MFVWIRSATRRASPIKFFWNSGMAEYSSRISLTATVFLNAYLGGQELARELPTAIANGVNAAPKEFSLPATLVDQQNIKAFLKKYPNVLKQTS